MSITLLNFDEKKSRKTFFLHKQMSEHAKIRNADNTEDLYGKSEAGKNHGGARVHYK